MAVHLIVRIALPSTAEKIFLAVSAIARDWTVLVARGHMWGSWPLADNRMAACAHVLLPLVAAEAHGGVLHPVAKTSVNLPPLVPIIKGATKVIKQDIPDSTVECPRSFADNPVQGGRVRGCVWCQIL